MEHHVSLPDIISLAEKKYIAEFNSRLFLEQLIFLDDIEDADITFSQRAVTREELSAFLQDCARKLAL